MPDIGDQGFYNSVGRGPKGEPLAKQIPAGVTSVDAKGRVTLQLESGVFVPSVVVGDLAGQFTPGPTPEPVAEVAPAAATEQAPTSGSEDPAAHAAAQEALKLAQEAHAKIDAQAAASSEARAAADAKLAALQGQAAAVGAQLDAVEASGPKS